MEIKMQQTAPRPRSSSLDAARAMAIMFVLVCHFSLENEYFRAHNFVDPFSSGVELFFLISGYGIAASILSKPFHLRAYCKKRIQKIYPGLLAALALCFVVNLWFNAICTSQYMADTFVQTNAEQIRESLKVLAGAYTIHGGGVYAFGPYWYISVILHFYIVMGILACCVKDDQTRRILIYTVSGIVVLICFITRVSILFGIQPTSAVLNDLVGWRVDLPFAGVLIHAAAELYRKRGLQPVKNSVFFSVFCVLIPVFVMANIQDNKVLTGIGYPVCVLCYGLLVFFCVTGNQTFLPQDSKLFAWFSSRSYSLFLYNLLGLQLAWLVINRFFSWTFYTGDYRNYGVVQVLFGGLICCVLAELNYRIIEKRGARRSA